MTMAKEELKLRDNLAVDRTAIAADPTLMAWTRTSIALISAGCHPVRPGGGWRSGHHHDQGAAPRPERKIFPPSVLGCRVCSAAYH